MKGALPESCQIDNAPLPPVRVLSLAHSSPCYPNPPPLTAHVPVVQPVRGLMKPLCEALTSVPAWLHPHFGKRP